jgi:hypothetical protein
MGLCAPGSAPCALRHELFFTILFYCEENNNKMFKFDLQYSGGRPKEPAEAVECALPLSGTM